MKQMKANIVLKLGWLNSIVPLSGMKQMKANIVLKLGWLNSIVPLSGMKQMKANIVLKLRCLPNPGIQLSLSFKYKL